MAWNYRGLAFSLHCQELNLFIVLLLFLLLLQVISVKRHFHHLVRLLIIQSEAQSQ